MNRLLCFILFFSFWVAVSAQQPAESVFAYTDKDLYLAGERICVRVDALIDGKPSPSRVAYVEIADTHKMYAQCMVCLKDGQGWAEIALPTSMHSGCYQLAAYTRVSQEYGLDAIHRSIIGVINADKLSRLDDIIILPPDSCMNVNEHKWYKVGETISFPLPEFDASGCCISVQKEGITADIPYQYKLSPTAAEDSSVPVYPEIEGHIVRARVADGNTSDVWMTRLALIGKTASLYDGKRQQDGSFIYFTSGISGNMPVMVNAFDSTGQTIPMELTSPYLSLLPKNLPRLTVHCQEDALRSRAMAARKQALVSESLSSDSLAYSLYFMSAVPDRFYDLDEYTQMNDVNEMLLEFIKGVKKEKRHGRNQLYTYDPVTKSFAKWAALVLLDGMPVYDINEILNYDAHLIRYVQVYSGIFNFGNSFCCGVISFITRNGRLSNYKLKGGERLMSYAFPQDHPDYVSSSGSESNNLLWLPAVKDKELKMTVPSSAGKYQVIIQGRKPNGETIRTVMTFKVEECYQ
ncbi:MAG: hypothetical protein KBT20_11795 [Bacteroidales bacterium]|nr:hypothetical protein [Candidatus Liminaster caballi]